MIEWRDTTNKMCPVHEDTLMIIARHHDGEPRRIDGRVVVICPKATCEECSSISVVDALADTD